jgi:2-polyprenyl-3-methyl-5-hydroxy-6-metoxy-1,4-benzoquinol methylase
MVPIHLQSATAPDAARALHDLNARLSEYYNSDTMREYYRTAHRINRVWSSSSYHALIRQLTLPGMRVIDMGCGSGHAFVNLKNRGLHYTGVDWSETQIAENRRIYGPEPSFVARPLYDTRLPAETYSLCFSLYVLEHMVWPHLLLKEMVRLARPRGLVVVLCPEFRSRARISSLRFGKVVAPLREKLRRGLLFDVLRHVFLRTIFYPQVIRRRYPREQFPFLINLEPSCFHGAHYADNDAVYFVDRDEVSAELARLGAEDCTASACSEYGFAWPLPRGVALIIARKTG